MALQNKVQLITYPDSIGEDLTDLGWALDMHLDGAVGGVHILPFYPKSAERGFAPLTHREVDPTFGTWEDIKRIGKKYDLMADLSLNHVSSESSHVRDFLDRDDEFEADLSKEKTRQLISAFVLNLIKHNVKIIRLSGGKRDTEKTHEDSFVLPAMQDTVSWVKTLTKPYKVELVMEPSFDRERRTTLFDPLHADRTHDSSLPLLVLHSLSTGRNTDLKNWIHKSSKAQLTVLDTHKGIDLAGAASFLTKDEITTIVRRIQERDRDLLSRSLDIQNVDERTTDHLQSTYYSALGENDNAYITARAVQFFVPGIPQVYYAGLLADSNSSSFVSKDYNGHGDSRHRYSLKQFKNMLEQEVVKRQLRLMRFRNTYPAFNGEFSLERSDVHELRLRFDLNDLYCMARIDLGKHTVIVEYVDPETKKRTVRGF